MRYSDCDYCGSRYQQKHDWQTLCPACYKLRQENGGKDAWIEVMDLKNELRWVKMQLASAAEQDRATKTEKALLDHIRANPRAWLSLVHPDRHDNSATATAATRLILSAR